MIATRVFTVLAAIVGLFLCTAGAHASDALSLAGAVSGWTPSFGELSLAAAVGMTYPKWVSRAPGIGPVLCQNEAEEKKLLDDWKSEQADTEVLKDVEGEDDDADAGDQDAHSTVSLGTQQKLETDDGDDDSDEDDAGRNLKSNNAATTTARSGSTRSKRR